MNLIELIEQIKWLPSINVSFVDVFQMLIIALVLYYLMRSVYKTRAWILVKGLFIIGAVYILICFTEMTVLQYIMQGLFSTLMIAIIIMLQPELQKIVEIIGQKRFTDFKSLITKKPDVAKWIKPETTEEICAACESMSKVKTGALIVLERGIPLDTCIESGIELKSAISRQLIVNIFEKNTPLHDGAVIIKNNKIESATSYLPLSGNPLIDKTLGTRHRAALGISETTDCLVVVVSEETGAISLCVGGQIFHNISVQELRQQMNQLALKEGDVHSTSKKQRKTPLWMKILAPVVALFVWLSVMSANDPIIVKTIDNVHVEVLNAEVLNDVKQTYLIKSGDVISVKVQGRRSIVDNMSASNLTATADFSDMSMVYAIPINIVPNENYEDVKIQSTHIMKLEVENLIQTEVPLSVTVVGDNNNNFVVSLYELESETITVTCSQSIAETLDKAVLTVDAYGKEARFISVCEPVVYDKNGEIVNTNRISLSQETIKATMDVFEVREIPIEVKIDDQGPTNLPDFYYELNGYSCEFETIRLAGPNAAMNGIDKITVTITTNQETAAAGSVLINLKQYIPDACYLAKDQKEQLPVSLQMTKFTKMLVNVAALNITITGNAEFDKKYKAEIASIDGPIVLYYNEKTVSKDGLTVSMLLPSIKISDNTPGSYETRLNIVDIDGVIIVTSPLVQFTITKKG